MTKECFNHAMKPRSILSGGYGEVEHLFHAGILKISEKYMT
jgi:hypothetical protein